LLPFMQSLYVDRALRAVCALLCCALLMVTRESITAQTPVYDGIDIVFAVDQSGSMGGARFGAQAGIVTRDPLGLRFEAVRYALATLQTYQRSVANDFALRMAVVSFGDNAEVTLPWITLQDTPDANDAIADALDALTADGFGTRNLGNTDFINAYEQVDRLFSSLPNDETHLRVVVVLSDGAPCAPARFIDINCASAADQTTHMDQVAQLTAAVFPAPSYRLYVIAVDETNNFWQRFAGAWTRIVGDADNARRVETATEVGQQFLQILADLVHTLRTGSGGLGSDVIGQQVMLTDGVPAQIAVSPYNQMMRITFFRSQMDSPIELRTPTGQPIGASLPTLSITGAGTPIEIWSIHNPEPGNWTLVTSNTDTVDVYLDLLRTTTEVTLSHAEQTRYLSTELRLRLLDSEGSPVQEYRDPRYQLSAAALVTDPDGRTSSLALQSDGAGMFTAPFIPTQVGLHLFDIVATTRDVDGSTLNLVDTHEAVTLMVTDITLQVTQQPDNRLFMSETLTVSAVVGDVNGQPIDPDGVSLRALVRGGTSGAELAYPLVAERDEAGAPVYTLDIPMNEIGRYQVVVQTIAGETGTAAASNAVIAESVLSPIDVIAANIIDLRVIEPLQGALQYTTDGFPLITQTDLAIALELIDRESGAPIDLFALGVPRDQLPFSLILTRVGGEAMVIDLTPLDQVGRYGANVPALPEGDYTIEIEITQNRITDTVIFSNEASAAGVSLTRVVNPSLNTFYTGSAIAAGVIVIVLLIVTIRLIRRRQHIARGILILHFDDYHGDGLPSEVWRMTLERKNSNRIVVSSGLPARFNRLVITCDDATMHARRDVRVEFVLAQGAPKRVLARPGSEQMVLADGDGAYTLVKDPTD